MPSEAFTRAQADRTLTVAETIPSAVTSNIGIRF
jgi:hypothetical protein